jgi:hypothetical protein
MAQALELTVEDENGVVVEQRDIYDVFEHILDRASLGPMLSGGALDAEAH